MYETPQLVGLKGVIALPEPASRTTGRDDEFISAVSGAFPTVVNRQVLPPAAPPNAPHLLLQSTSSRLIVSAVQADFDVRFYSDYEGDTERCLDYSFGKLEAVLAGFERMGAAPSMLGLIATVNFKQAEGDPDPAKHIADTHLHIDLDDQELIEDCSAKVALRLQNRHFISFSASNYVYKSFERPMMGGQIISVRPWEGDVDETGVELVIDVNNRLQSVVERQDPTVGIGELTESIDILRRAIQDAAPTFVSAGTVDLSSVEVSQS